MTLRDDLFEAHRTIVESSPKDALNFITNHPYSERLVQSLPEGDFHFFITSIGMEEAGPILALGSEKQWEYLLDIEIWDKESLNYLSFTRLLILIMSVNCNRLTTWCFDKKKYFIKLYLFRNINIVILDNDEDYLDLDDDFFTNDGTFYINSINYNTHNEHEHNFLEKRNMMIREMLLRFSNIDYVKYQALLLEVASIIPAELEEELLRLRNVRLAEKGFLPFYEAVGIYQPIKFKDIEKKGMKVLRAGKVNNHKTCYTTSYFLTDTSVGEKNLFLKALKNINDDAILQELKIELGALCNLVISADNKKIRNYKDLEDVINMVNCFLNIGTELILGKLIQQKTMTLSEVIKSCSLNDIFRLGYTQVLNLNQKVKYWYSNSWFSKQKLKLYFWGEYWFGILGGLLLDRPMLFNKSSLTYRNFEEYSDICDIEEMLDQIITIDSMFNQLNLSLSLSHFSDEYVINVKNLLLSIWFLHIVDLNKEEKSADFFPITLQTFQAYYDDLWEENLNGHKQIKRTKKNHLLTLVAEKMDLKISCLPEELTSFFDKLFQELEEELSEVSSKDIDPRYINLFIIDTAIN